MTMVDMRSNYTKDILEALESTYGETIGIFDSRIPMSVRAAETSAEGKSIYIHEPRGKVAKSYEELTEGGCLYMSKVREKIKLTSYDELLKVEITDGLKRNRCR